MALNKETIAWIAELAGVTVEDITTKIESEKEEGITKPQGEIFTEEELKTRDGSKYKEGKDAGSEMLVKNLKNKYGYEIEGKDVDAFMTYHDGLLKEKYSKGSTERVKELELDLGKQKKAYDEEILGLTEKNEQLTVEKRNQTIDNTLLFSSPKEMTMEAKRVVALFKIENPPIEVDGVIGVKGADGHALKDAKTGAVIPHSDVYKEWVVKEGFVKGNAGRGGGNQFGEQSQYSSKTPQDFQREWEKKNPDVSTTSPQYDQDYGEWRKANKEAATA